MRSLALKLALAFMVVGLIGSAVLVLLIRWQTQREFDRFILNSFQTQAVAVLRDYYQTHGSWEGVQDEVHGGIITDPQGPAPHFQPLTVADATGRVVMGRPEDIGRQITLDEGRAVPLEVDGEVVGWMLLYGPDRRWQPGTPEGIFLANFTRAIWLSGFVATALALGIGIFLARTISQPIRELEAATGKVAGGELGYQVTVRTKDELGQLASSFNQMSADLARSHNLRRQMTADIAHDLRTPLSIILGYTEALSEGELEGTSETFAVMHEEAQHLQRLIEDLRTLSLADAGELSLMKQSVSPSALLARTAMAHKPQAQEKQIAIEVEAAPDLPNIEVDPDRMAQVLGNLMSNALRYTPEGGHIRLVAERGDDGVRLEVSDDGAGIAADDLSFIFERFYRSDKSRRFQEGETGLGLAIARSLVEAHGGTITAESAPGKGSTFTVVIPV
jgi:two-component system sensor histidine kinase BaeS